MSNELNILVTLTDGNQLLKVAIKADPNKQLSSEVVMYVLEPENKEKIMAILPLYCQSFGVIVDVEKIFEIKDLIHSA